MKKILLMMLLAAFVSATTTPTLSKLMGFGPSVAFAQDDDDQGEDANP